VSERDLTRRRAVLVGAIPAVAASVLALTLVPAIPAGAGSSSDTTTTTTATDGTDDAALVAEGRELYDISCSSCHGATGEGTDLGPDLVGVGAASADFMLRTGRMPDTNPSRQATAKRPAFDDRQIEALVAYVASLGPGPPIPNVDDPRGSLQEGASLFLLNCAACHSAAGDGGALSYGRNAPELHSVGRTQVAEAMRIGPGPMPVFGPDTFSNEEVNSIVEYVTYLRDPEEPGGISLGVIGPVTEGLVGIFVGLGVLVLVVRWIEARA